MSRKFVLDNTLNHLVRKIKSKLDSHDTTLSQLESNKLNKSGDVMTGTLRLGTSETNNMRMAFIDKSFPSGYAYWLGFANNNGQFFLYDAKYSSYIVKADLDGTHTFGGHSTLDLPLEGGTITGDLKVNGRLDATAIGNALPIETTTVTFSSTSVSAGSTGNLKKTLSKSGYVPLGILNVKLTGTNNDKCNIYRSYVSEEAMSGVNGASMGYAANIYVRNNHTSSVNVAGEVTILWQKTFSTNALDLD